MAINKEHPQYAEYIQKCESLFDAYEEVFRKERAKYPEWRGQDHPSGTVIRPLARERNQKLKALQREYHFLFTDD